MSDVESAALRPLWFLCGGCAAGIAAGLGSATAATGVGRFLLAAGLVAAAVALARHPRTPMLWLLAGLALGAGRGLEVRGDQLRLGSWLADRTAPVALRVEGTIRESWTPTRWGHRTQATIRAARRGEERVGLPNRIALEVRGTDPSLLPVPGTTVEALAELRGDPRRPVLMSASPRVVRELAPPAGLHAVRERLAAATIAAAGTDPDRIRAAELAAALVLGRRDLLPAGRRDAWRRSGLAHLLAVSGLHVGVVAGVLWFTLVGVGVRPTPARWILLVALPGYALLAGAAPSALRAAIMAAVWLVARLLGRSPLPMAAVLAAVVGMLLVAPSLLADAGFQLTVLVTAALVRWVPVVARGLPGPPRLATAAAVPVVAQAAAAPLVAWRFRTLLPGAALVNLAAAPLLAPALVLAAAAVLASNLVPALARPAFSLLAAVADLLWWIGGAARAASWTPPAPSAWLVAVGALTAVAALLPGRAGRFGLAAWLALVVSTGAWWTLRAPALAPVALLPVADGTSAVLTTGGVGLLVDGGRFPTEAVRALADAGVREIEAVVASHTHDDHIGGLPAVVEEHEPRRLVVPRWALKEPRIVPLLRALRRAGGTVSPVAEGSVVSTGRWRLEVLWPPARPPRGPENERSLVLRALATNGTVLVTSDVGTATERRVAGSHRLDCDVLIAPHHGSRSSTGTDLLAAAAPDVVLVPAGTANPHHHPHADVISRLEAAGIPWRAPATGWPCGAEPGPAGWRPVP